MQLKDAESLRKRWGDKLCEHARVEREYFNDMQTGDIVCLTCGRIIYDEQEWSAYRAGKGPKLHGLDEGQY